MKAKEKIKEIISKKIEKEMKKDPREWPPGCFGFTYQPKRPQETINEKKDM